MAEASTNSTAADPLSLFVGIGLDEKTAKNAVANAKVTKNLIETIQEVRIVLSQDYGCVDIVVDTETPSCLALSTERWSGELNIKV